MRWAVVPFATIPACPKVEAWKYPKIKLQILDHLKDRACLVGEEKKQSRQWFIYENLSSEFHRRRYDKEMLAQQPFLFFPDSKTKAKIST